VTQGQTSVSQTALEKTACDLFTAAGVDRDIAETVAHDLVLADLRGLPSHGVMLVPMYLSRLRAGSVVKTRAAQVVSRSDGSIVVDAGHELGQITARMAVDEAVTAARMCGTGIVAVRNAFHMGALGLYTSLITEHGCIGLATSNTRPLLPAPGGAEAVTGNNPLAIAAPSSGAFPAGVDMALSAAAMGKIRNAAAAGEVIPDTWATDADERPTTDPEAAIACMLLPAAGPKGFGLAFLLDLLAGGLSGGGIGADVKGLYGDPAVPYACSALFIAIDVARFADPATFANRAEQALPRTPNERPAPGNSHVLSPGLRRHSRHTSPPARNPPAPQPHADLTPPNDASGPVPTPLTNERSR